MQNKRINIILDIDETLLHTYSFNFNNYKHTNIINPTKSNIGIINLPNYLGLVYIRPFLFEFLKYCFKFFNVGFWTAGSTLYCREVLKIILTKEQYEESTIILARDNENYVNIKTNIIYKNINNPKKIMKPLSLLWNDKELGILFNNRNTLLIDNDNNILFDNPNNSICIQAYDRLNNDDIILCCLSNWLNIIKNTNNIQIVEKNIKDISESCKNLKNYSE